MTESLKRFLISDSDAGIFPGDKCQHRRLTCAGFKHLTKHKIGTDKQEAGRDRERQSISPALSEPNPGHAKTKKQNLAPKRSKNAQQWLIPPFITGNLWGPSGGLVSRWVRGPRLAAREGWRRFRRKGWHQRKNNYSPISFANVDDINHLRTWSDVTIESFIHSNFHFNSFSHSTALSALLIFVQCPTFFPAGEIIFFPLR